MAEDARARTIQEHEAKMNAFIKALDLANWMVVWEPDEEMEELGRVIPDSRIIIVHDMIPKAAMRTVLHEVIELKMRPAFQVQRDLVNALIRLMDAQTYKMKERSIEDIVESIFALAGSDEFRGILDEISSS